jgi:hypothetical protein
MDRTIATPPPGMFCGPLYPWLIVGVTKLDDRFARTVDCGVEAHHGKRPDTDCESRAAQSVASKKPFYTCRARSVRALMNRRGDFGQQ